MDNQFTPTPTIHPAETDYWLVFDHNDQPVLPEISIDPELRSVTATYRFRSDRWSTPMDVHHGRRYLLDVSVWGGYADAAATIRMLAEDYAEDLALICDGYTAEWNGHDTVGRLTAEGSAALDRIASALGNSPRIDADHAGLWYAEEWLDGAPLDEVTCATTDTEIDEMASQIEDAARGEYVVFSDSLAAYLRSRRDAIAKAKGEN